MDAERYTAILAKRSVSVRCEITAKCNKGQAKVMNSCFPTLCATYLHQALIGSFDCILLASSQ